MSPVRVLIVDDDQISSRALKSGLSSHFSYEVITVTSGEQAIVYLSCLTSPQPDIILLDQFMRGMSGLETLDAFQRINPNIPVIMITAASSIDLATEFLKAGGYDFVTKPIRSLELLAHKINSTIERAATKRMVVEAKIRIAAMEQCMAAKSAFIAQASHDILSPLSGVSLGIGHVIQVMEKSNNSLFVGLLSKVKQSVDRVVLLLRNMLTMSRIEAGKVDYEFESADLCDVIREAIEINEETAQEKEIEIHFDTPSPRFIFAFARTEMFRVVSNLINNAIKFSAPKSSISIKLDSSKSEQITFSVKDTGVGIPEGEIGLIFDRFARSSRTRRNGEGVGLGLAICQEIVRAHSGNIWASNNPEGGAIFSVSIPTNLELRNPTPSGNERLEMASAA